MDVCRSISLPMWIKFVKRGMEWYVYAGNLLASLFLVEAGAVC